MGDIIDELGNTLPVPGNGREKRARIDRGGNCVAPDIYFYTNSGLTTAASRTSVRQLLTDSETLTGAGALSLTKPISLISGGVAYTLAAGTFIGQRKCIVNISGSNTIAATFLGPKSPITLGTAGETAQLLWTGSAWVIIGSAIHEQTGTAITNAQLVIGDAP